MATVTVILNTASGRGKARKNRETLSAAFTRAGVEHQVHCTDGPRHAEQLAAHLDSGPDSIVIAAGGDGTVNEVANGLLRHHSDRCPILGILPLGSGNDIAHNVGAPSELDRVADLVATPHVEQCDVAEITVHTDTQTIRRFFLNNAGLGLEAQVNVCSKSIQRLRKIPLYLLAAFRAISQFQPVPMTVTWTAPDGQDHQWQDPCSMVSVANGSRTGGGFRILPQARLNDQELDLGIVPGLGRLRLVWMLTRVMRGTHVRADNLVFGRFTHLKAESHSPFPVHVDGEVLTEQATDVTVELAPITLPILTLPGASG